DLDGAVALGLQGLVDRLLGAERAVADLGARVTGGPGRKAVGGLGHRGQPVLAGVAHPPLVTQPAQPLGELGQGQVEGGVLVVGGSLRPHHGAVHVAGDLAALGLLRLTRVGLVGEDDVGATHTGGELGNLAELVLQVAPVAIGDVLLATGHGEFHRVPPSRAGGYAAGDGRVVAALVSSCLTPSSNLGKVLHADTLVRGSGGCHRWSGAARTAPNGG